MPATAARRQQVERIDREKQTVARQSTRAVRRLMEVMRVAGMRTYRAGGDPVNSVAALEDQVAELLTSAMVIAHLTGRMRTYLAAIRALAGRGTVQLANWGPYSKTVETLRRRQNVTPDQLEGLRQLYGPTAIRATGKAGAAVERNVAKAVRESVEQGLHVGAGTEKIRRAYEAAGAGARPHVYEQVFRTQTGVAYSAGRVNAARDPAIQQILWGWVYVTVGDDRVRPQHVGFDGTRLPKDSSMWDSIMPRNGFNCRCDVIEVFKGEDDASVQTPQNVTVDGQLVVPSPDPGWEFNPGDLFIDTLEPARIAKRLAKRGLVPAAPPPVPPTPKAGPKPPKPTDHWRDEPIDKAIAGYEPEAAVLRDKVIRELGDEVKRIEPHRVELDRLRSEWNKANKKRKEIEGAMKIRMGQAKVGMNSADAANLEGAVANMTIGIEQPSAAIARMVKRGVDPDEAATLAREAAAVRKAKQKAEAFSNDYYALAPDVEELNKQFGESVAKVLGHGETTEVALWKDGGKATKAMMNESEKAGAWVGRMVDKKAGTGDGRLQVGVDVTDTGRAFADLGVIHMDKSNWREVYIHEMGHVLEDSELHYKRRAVSYLLHRKRGKEKWLGDDYKQNEIAFPTTFQRPYTGKVYRRGGSKTQPGGGITDTEVVSIGLEELYNDPVSMARLDPEFFNFIVGLIRGKI